VREHGGWIDVQSAAREGSRFFIYLPVNRPA
jgi:signal transduction histidine kinase